MNRSRKRTVAALVTAIVLVTMGCVAWVMVQNHKNSVTPRELSSFSVSAQQSDPFGVLEDTAFLITCDASFSKRELEGLITLEPSSEFTLQRQGEGEYLLTPKEPLSADTVYNLVVGDRAVQQVRTWAFQTRREVGILSSFPNDGNTYTDLYAGLEFELSHRGLNIAEHFSITPAVDGHWEYYNRTAVFVPSQSLSPNTLYTVTVSAGMGGEGGGVMAGDYVVRFRTRAEGDRGKGGSLSRTRAFQETFTTFDTPIVELYVDGFGNVPVAETSVYRLSGYEAYLSILGDYNTYRNEELGQESYYLYDAGAAGLTPEHRLQITGMGDTERSWGSRMFPLPEGLGPGYYLVDLTFTNPNFPDVEGLAGEGTQSIQKLIQITDASLYAQLSSQEALFWLNDSKGGSAIAGATVELSKSPDFSSPVTGKTGPDGALLLDVSALIPPRDEREDYFSTPLYTRITKGGTVLFADQPSFPSPDRYPYNKENYVSTLYLDRGLYQPTDEISFWGCIRPRSSGAPLPKTATAVIERDGTVLARLPVELSKSGAFTGRLSFERLTSSWYQLYIVDEQNLAAYDNDYQRASFTYNNFTIESYRKPEYVTAVKPDRLYYTPGQTANFTISTAFFEGTPAAGQTYRLSAEGQSLPEVRTNHNGEARISLTLPDKSAETQTYTPYTAYYEVTTTGAEDQYFSHYGELLVIPRNVLVKTVAEPAGEGRFDLVFTTTDVDVSKITGEGSLWDYTDYQLAGRAVDIPLKAQVYRVDVIRTPTGSYYDFINKETRHTYQYSEQEHLEREYSLKTTGGTARLEGLEYDGSTDYYYYVKVTGVDLNNRPFAYRHTIGYLKDSQRERYDGGYKTYTLRSDEDIEANDEYFYRSYLSLAENEPFRLTLYENNVPAQNKGRLLYVPSRLSIAGHHITTGNVVEMDFSTQYLPNMRIHAAYFDGRHLYAVEETYVSLDSATKELQVDIATDKDSYLPGDSVKATLTVSHADGTPAPGDFALGVVDEALFALRNQDYSPAAELYQQISLPTYTTLSSYVQYDIEAGSKDPDTGGKGGGGDGQGMVRSSFKDTAFFTSGVTDRNGRAQVTFTLPHNLTSWRLTAASVSGELLAGDEKRSIPVTQPFFVQPIVMDRFLTGDDVTFTARARGTGGFDPSQVRYAAVLRAGSSELATLKADGEVGSFNFGPLPAGSYTVTVTAQWEKASDSVEKAFTVLESGLEMPVSAPLALDAPAVEALRYPLTVNFYDAKYATYSKALDVLLSSHGRRIDARVARAWALEQLHTRDGGLPYFLEEEVDLSDLSYQPGVSLMPYGNPDWLLTGKLCAAAPQYLDRAAVAHALETWVVGQPDSLPGDLAGAYLGLAALKRPVLQELRVLVDDPSFTAEERCYLIAALGYIGDQAAAQAAYDRYIAPHMVRENDWAYVTDPADPGSRPLTFEATARALLAATSLGSPDATLLAEYLCANPSSKTLANLELMAYMSSFDPKADARGKFTYVDSQGRRQTVNLAESRTHTAAFTKEGLAAANFKVLGGDVGATVLYVGGADAVDARPIEGISMVKRVENANGSSVYAPGDLVTVSIEVTFGDYAPPGYYSLSDYLPSGLRYAGLPNGGKGGEAGSSFAFLERSEGQNLSFGLYYTPAPEEPGQPYAGEEEPVITILNPGAEEDEEVAIDDIPVPGAVSRNPDTSGPSTPGQNVVIVTYTARCVLPGHYRVDSAYLTQSATGRIMATEESAITVEPFGSGSAPQIKLTTSLLSSIL